MAGTGSAPSSAARDRQRHHLGPLCKLCYSSPSCFPSQESFPKRFARLSKAVRCPQQPPHITFQAHVSLRGWAAACRAAGRQHCGLGCTGLGTPAPAPLWQQPRAGTSCPGREGRENGRSPVLLLPGAHLAPGLCCRPASRWGWAGGGREGPGTHISPRSKVPAGGGGTSQARGGHYQPLLFAFLCAIRPTPSPLGSKGSARIEAASFQRGNSLFPLISRQRGELDP